MEYPLFFIWNNHDIREKASHAICLTHVRVHVETHKHSARRNNVAAFETPSKENFSIHWKNFILCPSLKKSIIRCEWIRVSIHPDLACLSFYGVWGIMRLNCFTKLFSFYDQIYRTFFQFPIGLPLKSIGHLKN